MNADEKKIQELISDGKFSEVLEQFSKKPELLNQATLELAQEALKPKIKELRDQLEVDQGQLTANPNPDDNQKQNVMTNLQAGQHALEMSNMLATLSKLAQAGLPGLIGLLAKFKEAFADLKTPKLSQVEQSASQMKAQQLGGLPTNPAAQQASMQNPNSPYARMMQALPMSPAVSAHKHDKEVEQAETLHNDVKKASEGLSSGLSLTSIGAGAAGGPVGIVMHEVVMHVIKALVGALSKALNTGADALDQNPADGPAVETTPQLTKKK